MDVLVLRDPREAAAKCSLTPLREQGLLRVVEYRPERRLAAGERVLLHPDGDQLGPADRGRDLLLIDCAWRRVPSLLRTVDGVLHPRRLPPLTSAYPRRSRIQPDPAQGLSSVEALFVAALILGEARSELLARYRWREEFLTANRETLAPLLARASARGSPPGPALLAGRAMAPPPGDSY